MKFEVWQSILIVAGIAAGGILIGWMLELATKKVYGLIAKYRKT